MVEPSFYIRKLEQTDNVQHFKLGSEAFLPLKTFLQKQAKTFQQSNVAQTYVALIDGVIAGFITLTCSEIDLQENYDLSNCSHANNYEYLPAVKIARLAVDSRFRGKGIGSALVDFAIALIRDRVADSVGCRFVVTDAKIEAVEFYDKQGFTTLNSYKADVSDYHLMFLDLDIL
jgi:ribosomal protein S18 acetylase RimI-like enzyme